MEKNYELIYKCSEYCIIRILDFKTSLLYSKDTNFCSLHKEKFEYTKNNALMYRFLFKDKFIMRLTYPYPNSDIKISFGLGGKNDKTKFGFPKDTSCPLYNTLSDSDKFYFYQQISPRYDDIFVFDNKNYGIRSELVRRINIINTSESKKYLLENIRNCLNNRLPL